MFEKPKDECDLKVGNKWENDTKLEREGPVTQTLNFI